MSLKELRGAISDISDWAARAPADPASTVEALAAHILLERPQHAGQAGWPALEHLMARQSPDDSYGDVIAAAFTMLALSSVGARGGAWSRSLDYLIRVQRSDGSWTDRTADVVETALITRALRDDPAFAEHALPGALAFLCSAQRHDGGWGATVQAPSDVSLTGLVLSAVAGLPLPRHISERACAYLMSRQTPDGLWGHGKPCEETVAHVVAALRQHVGRHHVPYDKAERWLAARVRNASGLAHGTSHILGLPYAVHQMTEALGCSAPESVEAARTLASLQNPDGGWPEQLDGPSTPAATGIALVVLRQCGLLTAERRAPALDHLVSGLGEQGTWRGSLPEMARIWPLPVQLSGVTHALAAWGLHAALRPAEAAASS
ncbi:prenyltransferase/squalene oxidase repeat-containing protein [Streptomyces sp. V4I23]|uniref:prenyltransferase/squalene oxidase repeat-containing protein n=1 Tax=Streptomyces sp. V4I23 TaxID=3042282 RepID=UPI0027D7F8BD|nr:prenyltransferase/squalene oxidase repeat-containing protein [Streptomyces sp. V4I23]